jgi:hypothetical protein
VSIQNTAAGDAVSGHLSWGLLVDRDQVLVPGPFGWLRDTTISFEVLLASSRANGDFLVERIKTVGVDLTGLETQLDDGIAALQLDHGSEHGPTRLQNVSGKEMAALIADGHSVWEALEKLGAVPAGILARSVPKVLEPVKSWEAIVRERLVKDGVHPVQLPQGIPNWLCCAFSIACGNEACRTQCNGPWW